MDRRDRRRQGGQDTITFRDGCSHGMLENSAPGQVGAEEYPAALTPQADARPARRGENRLPHRIGEAFEDAEDA